MITRKPHALAALGLGALMWASCAPSPGHTGSSQPRTPDAIQAVDEERNCCSLRSAIDMRLRALDLPGRATGGVAQLELTVETRMPVTDLALSLVVEPGGHEPIGLPSQLTLEPGQPIALPFELALPAGDARYDVVAELRGTLRGASCAEVTNLIVEVGAPEPEPYELIQTEDGRLLRVVRPDSRLWRNDR